MFSHLIKFLFFKALHQEHIKLNAIERRLSRDWELLNEQKLKIQSQQDDLKRRINVISEIMCEILTSLGAELKRLDYIV